MNFEIHYWNLKRVVQHGNNKLTEAYAHNAPKDTQIFRASDVL